MEFWQVTSDCKLPKGYCLHEDVTGLYLYTDNELVATFTHHTNFKLIESFACNHKNRLMTAV